MKVAAQLYTVREFTNSEAEVAETLEKIKKIGYDAVQVSGIKAYEPVSLAKRLKELGLTVCITHNSLERIVNETDKLIEEHHLFGAKYVGIGFFRGQSLDDYKAFLDKVLPAVEKFNAAGLGFLYHNHAHEFRKFDGVRPIDYLRENTPRGMFGFLPDLYWVQAAGASPIKFLRDFAGRTPIVHFKDMRYPPAEGKTSMAEIFEGNMDYDAIYAECLAQGVQWAAVEQDECDGDPFSSLALSLSNMKKRGMFVQ